MNQLLRIIKNFPLLLSILTFVAVSISYLNLFFFYRRYGIDISEYISLSEVLILSITDLVLILLSAFIHYTYIHQFSLATIKENRTSARIATGIMVVVAIIAGVLTIENKELITHTYLGRFFISNILGVMCAMIAVIPFFGIEKSRNFLDSIGEAGLQVFSITAMLLSLVLMIWLKNYASPIERTVRNKNVELHLQDNTIFTSNDSTWLLGRTEKYYFIYDLKKNQSSVFSASDVKKQLSNQIR